MHCVLCWTTKPHIFYPLKKNKNWKYLRTSFHRAVKSDLAGRPDGRTNWTSTWGTRFKPFCLQVSALLNSSQLQGICSVAEPDLWPSGRMTNTNALLILNILHVWNTILTVVNLNADLGNKKSYWAKGDKWTVHSEQMKIQSRGQQGLCSLVSLKLH